ncbi:MAG TPA: NAD(P)H-dependent oxidoreductase [Gemmatimonadales bacterium]|nr:NAD(P)H-dependent oxidoreductase [Gemmatimonadales bacterium]
MRLLAFAASLRRDSLNKKLLALAAERLRALGAEVDHADFADFDAPLYNADLQHSAGFPPGVEAFVHRLQAVDGLMIASPEYNYSLPGTLKNLIDWASRVRPVPFRGKSGVLLAASNGVIGGIRGLWQLRIPLEGNGVFLYPDMFALASAGQAFDDEGRLRDAALAERLEHLLVGYLAAGRKLAGKEEEEEKLTGED